MVHSVQENCNNEPHIILRLSDTGRLLDLRSRVVMEEGEYK